MGKAKASLPECRELIAIPGTGWPNALAFGHGDKELLASDFGPPHVYEVKSGKQTRTFAKPGSPDSKGVCWWIAEPSADVAIAALYGSVAAWSAHGTRPLRHFTSPRGIVASFDIPEDLSTLVMGTHVKALAAFDFKSGAQRWHVTGKVSFSNRVALTPDGKHCVTGGNDKTVRLFEMATGKEVHRIGTCTGWVQGLVVLPDGRRVAAAGRDRVISLWNIAQGGLLATLAGHTKEIRALRTTVNGRFAVSAGGDGARVWDLKANLPVAAFNGHQKSICCLALSSDDKLAATGGEDGMLRVWELPT